MPLHIENKIVANSVDKLRKTITTHSQSVCLSIIALNVQSLEQELEIQQLLVQERTRTIRKWQEVTGHNTPDSLALARHANELKKQRAQAT